jgi:CoA:oxalate CoA-transferase
MENAPRIIDLSTNPMGGYATRMLAAYGAEVIKVEQPGTGDPTRSLGPFPNDEPHPERCATSLFLDFNKKSVTLDLRQPRGRELLDALLARADAMVMTFTPSEIDALGLTYANLEPRFPRLVVTSITPFGLSGPYRDFNACDLVREAMSGWLFQSGEPDKAPTRTRGEMPTAMVPGLLAASGTLAALAWRAESGEGQLVEIAAMEAMLAASRYYETTYAQRGAVIRRLGTTLGPMYCYRPARDGWTALCAATDQQRELMAHLMGLSELANDPALQPGDNSSGNHDEIVARVDSWAREHDRDETFHLLQQTRVPCGYLTRADEVLQLEQLRARDAFVRVDHPMAGALEYPGAPFKMGVTGFHPNRAPLLGEHNRDIYQSELGLSADECETLRQEGVI